MAITPRGYTSHVLRLGGGRGSDGAPAGHAAGSWWRRLSGGSEPRQRRRGSSSGARLKQVEYRPRGTPTALRPGRRKALSNPRKNTALGVSHALGDSATQAPPRPVSRIAKDAALPNLRQERGPSSRGRCSMALQFFAVQSGSEAPARCAQLRRTPHEGHAAGADRFEAHLRPGLGAWRSCPLPAQKPAWLRPSRISMRSPGWRALRELILVPALACRRRVPQPPRDATPTATPAHPLGQSRSAR